MPPKMSLRNPGEAMEAYTGVKRGMQQTEHENQACRPAVNQFAGGWNATGMRGKEGTGYTAQMGEILMGDVMDRAAGDHQKMHDKANADMNTLINGEDDEGRELGSKNNRHKDDDDKSDYAGEEEDGKGADQDDDLMAIRRKRMEQMMKKSKEAEEFKAKGHGELDEIKEEEFLKTVTKSYRCVVHFYSDEFESCKVADHHMKRMAKKYMSTKFVKMDANKAPFFIQKLNIQTLPTLGVFLDGVMVYKQLGFMGISEGGENPNDFPTWRMARVLSAYDGIEDEVDSDEEFPQA